MSSRIPPQRTVDFTRTVVKAKLPIEFDRSTWFAEFHAGYLALRRARTTEMFTITYEGLVQRAIAIAVEERRRARREARRAKRRRGGRPDGSH
jgi:hypothetical protein